MRNKVLVIVGPTAVGKTAISIELAKRLNGEIISADSMQIYKSMDIGTAKPTNEEMQGIIHYMIDIVKPDEEFNVARYKEMAEECIKLILNKNKLPIIVGGTGLYIDSVVKNIEYSDTITDWEYRKELEDRANKEGIDKLHDELKEIDITASEKIHPNDLRRIIRALEVYKHTGIPISKHQELSKQNPPKYDFNLIGLNIDRETLYKRIDIRVDKMMEQGLIDEVRNLVEMGIGIESTSMQGLGYKEMLKYIKGDSKREDVIELIKRDSRRYAKRQFTWFNRNKEITWFDSEEEMEKNIKKIINYLEEVRFFI